MGPNRRRLSGNLDDDGNWRTLAPSSVVLFRAGVVSRWRVSAYVRKHAIRRVALPVSMGLSCARW